MTSSQQARFDFVPTKLAVQAMRDNGYKNAAYAVSELIDNSIQAGAKGVELLCVETEQQGPQRRTRRISEVAVLDNGIGMNGDTLRIALQFGNGTRLEDRSGIGRFGMGLPSASISQCRRVDVWSWQSGIKNSLHTYLDLDEIENSGLAEVPEATPTAVPETWRNLGQNFGNSGTLAVWSKLDRCTWRTANAIVSNSEALIGRMYRKFIHRGDVSIRLATFLSGNSQPQYDRFARVNDPMYLMVPSMTPEPYGETAMFEPIGDDSEVTHKIWYNGEEHEVFIRFSMAKISARDTGGQAAGSTPYGMDAKKNVGISVLRAGRELELEQGWVEASDARERWWGIEVEFPPSLDDIFGVTNNKQSARYFSHTLDYADMLGDGKTISEIKEELLDDEDPSGPLLDIADTIRRNLRNIRSLIRTQMSHMERQSRKRYEADSPEVRATEATKARQADGLKGGSDEEEGLPTDERTQSIEDELIERGMPEPQARELAARTISTGMKYVFTQGDIETPAFFSVRSKGGALIITLNTSHPAYNNLLGLLDDSETSNLSSEELVDKLTNAWRGLKLVLEAWARYEDEQPDGPLRTRTQDARNDWGRVARQFLEEV